MRKPEWPLEVEKLRQRLQEAEDALRAIRAGQSDTPALKEADHPCRNFLETMNGGAVTLMSDGTIAYCNRHFSDLLGTPLELVMGASLEAFVAPHHRHRWRPLLAQALSGNENSFAGTARPSRQIQLALKFLF